jgi:hypothetical protein
MSGLDLASFLLPHLPFIVPLLSDMPVCQRALQRLLLQMTTMPTNVLDEVHRWLRPVLRVEEDEIIQLCPIAADEEVGIVERALARNPVLVANGNHA